MTDLIGQRIRGYQLLLLLGSGSSARVYLGKQRRNGSYAAIKLLSVENIPERLEGWQNETRLLSRFNHPHILRMQTCGMHEGQPFRIMPWAQWGTLGDLFTWRVSFQNVARYIKQIASALAYLHAHHLVHRDLKPNNILVGQYDQLLLNDFEWTVDYRFCHSTIGTPVYAAPEQKRGYPCPASDQYALGVVVYQWLAGEPSAGNRLFSPLHGNASPLPHPIDEVLRIALARDPTRRFASIQLFADALEQASQTVSFLTPSQNIAAIGTDNPGHLT
jgi:serine/threonine protein kinase